MQFVYLFICDLLKRYPWNSSTNCPRISVGRTDKLSQFGKRYFTNRDITQHKLRGKSNLPQAFFEVGLADLESKRTSPRIRLEPHCRGKMDLPLLNMWLLSAFSGLKDPLLPPFLKFRPPPPHFTVFCWGGEGMGGWGYGLGKATAVRTPRRSNFDFLLG